MARRLAADPAPAPARRPRRRTLIAAVAGIALVAVATIGLSVTRPWAAQPACPPRGRRIPSGRSRGAGTRRCSTRSVARSRTRRSTPATCSTRRSRCGTHGRPTTRRPAATSSPRSTPRRNVDGRPQRGDQLCGLPRADVALHQGGRRRRVAVRVRRRDGRAVLPARRRRRPRATRRPRSATGSRRRSSPTA